MFILRVPAALVRGLRPCLVLLCLGAGTVPPVLAQSTITAVITVDAAASRRPISPLIYGVANATPAQLAGLNAPLHRLGGNHTSRYNWQANAYNRGSDWFFQSVAEPGSAPGAATDTFVAAAQGAAAQPMVTIPTLGWVARLGRDRSRLSSFSVAKYGPQAARDEQWMPDAGNGRRVGGAPVTGNDPSDASLRVTPAFQGDWVRHLVSRWGGAAGGGVRYYIADNEPSLWHQTHADVHPEGATMEEIRSRLIDYSAAVKAADPFALVVGPEEWGWAGYLFSGYDQQWADRWGWLGTQPDRASHGGQDYLPWLLDQLRRHNAATGQRVLDVFSVHYYPQGGEHSDDTSPAMQLRRNRSTRSLWDPTYVDESWIGSRVNLIPRLRGWADSYYAAGTPVGLTEYNWGAENHISGALAQADLLGIFGREGLEMAVRWGTPDPATPTFKAMQLYRNYDGRMSSFGETSVRATGHNPDEVAAFAAVRQADGALTVMVINKSAGPARVTIGLSNFPTADSASRWQLTSANTLKKLEPVAVGAAAIRDELPARSVTLFVVPPAGAARPSAQGPARISTGGHR